MQTETPTRPSVIQSETAVPSVRRFDPLSEPGWDEFVERSSSASLFHTRAWLEALHKTYGYKPVVFTTSPEGGRIDNGIVFCRVESWLTGRRLVSLPFSDFCQPLVDNHRDQDALFEALDLERRKGGWRYVELRPFDEIETARPMYHVSSTYFRHEIDLSPSVSTLFLNLHKNSIQRKIRRAEREGLEYQEGTSDAQLDAFHRLMVITRKRHSVPPQPKAWFRNLVRSFGNALKIRLALKDGRPVAAMMTIRHKDTLVYKYGGSEAQFSPMGGMHLLYWRSMLDAKQSGLKTFDLGRCEVGQTGLLTFKKRWGAVEMPLHYVRFTDPGNAREVFEPASRSINARIAKQVFSHAPGPVLSALGGMLYKHVG
jgi:CelD/BcsL family acetyltransferase involved in cellulose biosynthesis